MYKDKAIVFRAIPTYSVNGGCIKPKDGSSLPDTDSKRYTVVSLDASVFTFRLAV